MYNILVAFRSITLLHVAAFWPIQNFSPRIRLVLLVVANWDFYVMRTIVSSKATLIISPHLENVKGSGGIVRRNSF